MIEGLGTSFIELFFIILGIGLYLYFAFGFWKATSRVCTLVSYEHSKNPILIITSLFWPITVLVLIFIEIKEWIKKKGGIKGLMARIGLWFLRRKMNKTMKQLQENAQKEKESDKSRQNKSTEQAGENLNPS